MEALLMQATESAPATDHMLFWATVALIAVSFILAGVTGWVGLVEMRKMSKEDHIFTYLAQQENNRHEEAVDHEHNEAAETESQPLPPVDDDENFVDVHNN